MTDKMSKEEALSVLNEFLSRNHLELVANVKEYVLKIVESIEPEHKKVVLPKEVGEQWDKLVANQPSDNEGNSVEQPDKLYRVYVPRTDQVYVYTHRVWSDRKVHLETQEFEEQSDDLTELFTERQIDELKLQDYEREEAKGYVK